MGEKEFFEKIDGIVDPVVGELIKKHEEVAFKAGREAQLGEDLRELMKADTGGFAMLDRNITSLIFAWQTKLNLKKRGINNGQQA